MTIQPTLQGSLFGAAEPHITGPLPDERTDLDHEAWIVRVPGWIGGDHTLLDHLTETTSWHSGRRPMYDRMVDVPRLTASIPKSGPGHPVLREVTAALRSRFDERMDRIGLALYRDGRDSVAPHGDTVAREMHSSTMAIVSCGAPRRFLLSPVGGGASVSFDLGHGDLLVMGGTIQRTWRHGVPKTNRAVGPRMSIMFRPRWETGIAQRPTASRL
ncbi:MAG TPA: alpha-ketoglutarate-dependent dioxygenase AlkB [Acidimicrobiales bacterium]|nr:alpha-ketoglutarate-dependent dioxygenase AlkB [Acidimicrobiales bacterium]